MYNIIYQFKYYAPTSTTDGSAQQTQKKKKKKYLNNASVQRVKNKHTTLNRI